MSATLNHHLSSRKVLGTLTVALAVLTGPLGARANAQDSTGIVPGSNENVNVAAQTSAEMTPPQAPAHLAEIKARGAAAIADRLARLQVLTSRVAAVRGDCGNTAALTAQLAADVSGLTALGGTLAAETDVVKAREEYRQIFVGFRIYLLQSPKTHIVVNCGNNAARSVKLQGEIADVQAKINAAIAAGKDASASQAFIVTASGLVTAANALGTTASNSVIVLVPDQGDKAKLEANKAALAGASSQIKQADGDLASAAANIRAARHALPRGGNHHVKPPVAGVAVPSTIAVAASA